MSCIENEYRYLVCVNWSLYTLPTETVAFWAFMLNFQNAVGDKPFKELATYALQALCMPVSNACIERVFFACFLCQKQAEKSHGSSAPGGNLDGENEFLGC